MTAQTQSVPVRDVPIAALFLSETASQRERRKHLDQAALAELAESIRSVGMLQPIVARPRYTVRVRPGLHPLWYVEIANTAGGWNVHGHHHPTEEAARKAAAKVGSECELVAGERRFLAARQAGLEQVPVSVRELTDQQVIEIQLVENLQRQDLHELAEAEGYEALMKRHGYTVEDLVAKVGKSKGTVYARLKLLTLGKEARAAFYDGKLTASTALLLARIPVPELQKKALKEILEGGRWRDGPLNVREAAEHIREGYMLRLDQAGFKTTDAELVPAAGPCTTCPKRTGNQPEVFKDVDRADVCTDPICFQAKRDAHKANRLAAATAAGQRVIVGKEAKKIAAQAYGSAIRPHTTLGGGLVQLDKSCYEDERNRPYRKILGKSAPPPILLEDPASGELVEVLEQKVIAPLLKEKGVKPRRAPSSAPDREHAQRVKKAKLEGEYRRRLLEAVLDKAPAALDRGELEAIAVGFIGEIWNETVKRVFKRMGWEPEQRRDGYGRDYQAAAVKRLPELSDAELARFLLLLAFAKELTVNAWDTNSKPERLLRAAEGRGVDAAAIRRAVMAEDRAKEQRKKKATAKKKASAKKAPAARSRKRKAA